AALVYALRQPPTGREKPGGIASRRATATPAGAAAPAATATPDELVIAAPRILEDATPTALPKPNATRTAVPAPVPPTVAPPPAPPTAAAASNAGGSSGRVDVPGMGELTPRKMRRLMEDWKSRPLDRRAFLAVRTAYIANLFVRESPNDPLSAEIREKLPGALR